MNFRLLLNIIKKTVLSTLSIIIIVFSLGTTFLRPFNKIITGHGFDEALTGKGVYTNHYVLLATSSVFIIVLACVMIFELKKRKKE